MTTAVLKSTSIAAAIASVAWLAIAPMAAVPAQSAAHAAAGPATQELLQMARLRHDDLIIEIPRQGRHETVLSAFSMREDETNPGGSGFVERIHQLRG